MYRKVFKRIFDIIVGSALVITLLPVIIMTTLCSLIYLKSNPFFVQKRPGLNGVIFKLYKFRTMYDYRDTQGNLLDDDKRIFFLGNILRKLSLDELPQLVNVIKGDMSLIGPRPLLPEYLEFYNQYHKRRHEVRPGITGWAQVNGRNAISWKQRLDYDVWYVDNVTFAIDWKIFFLTILKVIKKENISSSTNATMEKFKGI